MAFQFVYPRRLLNLVRVNVRKHDIRRSLMKKTTEAHHSLRHLADPTLLVNPEFIIDDFKQLRNV